MVSKWQTDVSLQSVPALYSRRMVAEFCATEEVRLSINLSRERQASPGLTGETRKSRAIMGAQLHDREKPASRRWILPKAMANLS